MAQRDLPALLGALAIGLVVGLGVWWWLGAHGRDTGGYASADWATRFGATAHFSAFAFRDRNRDGVLDLGDRPMAGVAVEMTSPRGRTHVERSNQTGFVNFDMSGGWPLAPIRGPGERRFRTLVPPGWSVTSGNAEQTCEFEELPGSPSGLIARNPTRPVGLAPDLSIGGRVETGAGPVTAQGPTGALVQVAVDPGGSFAIPAAPGSWRLRAGGGPWREVAVADVPLRLSALGGPASRPPAAREVVVDFESATTQTWKIRAGLGGVDWFYLNAIEAVPARGPGYVNTLGSGRYVAYSSSGHPVTISRRGGFDFVGGYFGVGWADAEGEILRIEARRGGAVVGAEELRLSALGPVWFDADYRAIDELRLSTAHYWQFVTDDLILRLDD
jgi:hypothetical protein